MALTNKQLQSISPEELEVYETLDSEGKQQFEYFQGFTSTSGEAFIVTNKEIIEYRKAAASIQLKTVAQLLDFVPHAGQQPVFYTFDQESEVYNNYVLLFGRRAQPLSSVIHGPKGPITFEDIKVGDSVFRPKGGLQTVTEVHDIYDGDVYEVTLGSGVDKTKGARTIRCDIQHLFTVVDHHGNTRTLDMEHISKHYKHSRKRNHPGSCGVEYAFKVYNPAPLAYPAKELTMDPYTLGLILGDGCISTNSSTLGMQDKKCLEHIANIPEMKDFRGTIRETYPGYYHMCLNCMNPLFISMGLLGTYSATKFIPEEYFTASVEQRLALLRGLMDTDGYLGNGIGAEYTTVSPQLSDGVERLAKSLGANVKISTKIGSYTKEGVKHLCKKVYRLIISMETNPFMIPRKAEGWKYPKVWNYITDVQSIEDEPVRCITVSGEEHTYVSDDMVVTHNTGKSSFSSVVIIRELLLPHSSTILLTPVFENSKIIFNEVLKKVAQLGLPIKSINRGSFRLELENGARFSANSAANVEAALGSSNSLIVVDETQSVPDIKRILNMLLVPTLLDYGVRDSGILWAHQLLIGTPRGEENELSDYFYRELTVNNWKSFTAPTTSNPTLPVEYVKNMRIELGETLYRQEILAEIVGNDKNVFYAFDKEVNTFSDGDAILTYHSLYINGIDIGWSDSTANIMIYRTPRGIYYVQKAYQENQKTTREHIANYRALEADMMGECDVRYCDPSAAQTINDYITDYDYDVLPAKNDIMPSIEYINTLLEPSGANMTPRLYIHEDLGELIRQVLRIRFKPTLAGKKSNDPFIKDPDGTHWDLIAALRYALFSDRFNMSAVGIIQGGR